MRQEKAYTIIPTSVGNLLVHGDSTLILYIGMNLGTFRPTYHIDHAQKLVERV